MHALDAGPFAARLIVGMFAAAITWLLAIDYGCALVSRCVPIRHPAARVAVGAAVGYAMLGCAVALLGLFGAIKPSIVSILLIVAVLARARHHVRRLRALPARRAAAWLAARAADGVARALGAVALFALVSALISAALPAVWWDPIAYHLPLVSTALTNGALRFNPQMVQSGFPLLAEAAAIPAYAIAGSAGAAMSTLGAGLALVLAILAVADMLVLGTGVLAGALVACSALWLWLAPSFYVDVPLALFLIAAVVLVLESRGSTVSQWTAAAMCGALCGAAASVKYSGLEGSLVLFALVIYFAAAERARIALAFLAGFALVAGWWYARTWLLTGDPVYPFLSTVLGRSLPVRDFAARYVDMTRHWCGGGISVSDAVMLPYRLLVQPRIFCGDPGYALRLATVFFIAGCAMVRSVRPVALATAALVAFWFFGSQQLRFALPAVCLFAAVAAAGTGAVGNRLRPVAGYTLAALCAAGVLVNWVPSTRVEASSSIVPAFAYIRGLQTGNQYLEQRLETFAAARWMSDHHIAGAQTVALDDVRDYYFPGAVWANPYYQQTWALNWGATMSERYGLLRAHGFRYMVVNENEAYLRRTPVGVDFAQLASDEVHGLHRIFTAHDVVVYDLGVQP